MPRQGRRFRWREGGQNCPPSGFISRYLAQQIGITELHAGKSPEEKLAIVRSETQKAKTLYVGDGINDAPALMAATIGVAFGPGSDITSEAAAAVIMNTSLEKVDELLHLSRRMRRIALESAVGGMALSEAEMGLAGLGYLPPVAGAIAQELLDVGTPVGNSRAGQGAARPAYLARRGHRAEI